MSTCLIYGSYGYTGKLIVEQAVKEGFMPILAGRNKKKLEDQSATTDLSYRCFDLRHADHTRKALEDVHLVVHCAGPFVHTLNLNSASNVLRVVSSAISSSTPEVHS